MSDSRPEVRSQFGPYLLRRLIGSGGMGSVYEAQDTVMDRVVALKLISGPYAQDPEYRQRLQREARIAGRLQDPHVAPVHSTGEIDGQLYVDMRLINGTDLETILSRSGALPPNRAVAIVRQIASALDSAHAAGVLHRDVKPGNILITHDDFAYLVDFGIANAATEQRLTQMGDVLGTWDYMAPERFTGNEVNVTPAADTYALACVLYEALTGSPPYSGDRVSLVGAHLTQPVPRASERTGLPTALDEVIARGMAKQPQDRYASSGEFARAAEAAVANLRVPTGNVALPGLPPPSGPNVGPPPGPGRGKRGRWVLLAAAILGIVALAAGLSSWQLTSRKSSAQHSVDISKLDVGHYGTKPRSLSGTATMEDGRFLEAFRLAEGVVNPYEVDPVLDHLYENAVADAKTAATSISGTNTPLVQPVLEKYGMISAYQVQGLSKRSVDLERDKFGDVAVILLTSYPNDDAAAHAATEIDSTDFAVSPENRGLVIPGYPQAKSHFRPGSPSVGATLAWGRLVTSVLVRSDANPGTEYLTQRVKRIFDLQIPLMDRLLPSVETQLTTLPLDPDHMLSRLFAAEDQRKISARFGSLGPHAVYVCADSQAVKDGLLKQAGVDRCAFGTDAQLLRAQDENAARIALPKLVEAERQEYIDHDVAPADGVTASRCYETKQSLWADAANLRFQCLVTYGRYIATVWSNEEKDVRQRAAAQYAILVNSA